MSLIADGTNGITLPSWTTSTRPSSPSAGQIGFNSTTHQVESFNGSIWVQSGYGIGYLIVGGGGGGANGIDNVRYSAGGSGGQVLIGAFTSYVVGTTYNVVVGAGGAATANGSSSSVFGLTAAGGYGATSDAAPLTQSGAGAGGAANSAGSSGITLYAAGGGGSRNCAGGVYGGGAGGGTGVAGYPGVANTGSGGGGGDPLGSQVGGAGGSGIVILTIPTAIYTGTYTGTPTIVVSGSFTILKFLANGSYTA